eukprot:scaffold14394_cov78-Phaeocystis_antarctica.AAC.1
MMLARRPTRTSSRDAAPPPARDAVLRRVSESSVRLLQREAPRAAASWLGPRAPGAMATPSTQHATDTCLLYGRAAAQQLGSSAACHRRCQRWRRLPRTGGYAGSPPAADLRAPLLVCRAARPPYSSTGEYAAPPRSPRAPSRSTRGVTSGGASSFERSKARARRPPHCLPVQPTRTAKEACVRAATRWRRAPLPGRLRLARGPVWRLGPRARTSSMCP